MNKPALFLGKFLRKPLQIGAVAPSSAGLAELITEGIGLERARTIVELGCGTGAFTGVISERADPAATFLAVEVDPTFARTVRERFPRAQVVNGPAEQLVDYLKEAGGSLADCIVSGLPWAGFTAARQTRILDAVVASLRPGGWFTTFAYIHAAGLPPGRRFRRLLDTRFSVVERSRVVWKNLPPAFVYRCRETGAAGGTGIAIG